MKSWERLIANVTDPALIRDHEGRVVSCNARFAELLGRGAGELEGRRLDEVAGAALASLSEALDLFERSSEESTSRELSLGSLARGARSFRTEFIQLSGSPRPLTLALLAPLEYEESAPEERLLEVVSEALAPAGAESPDSILESARSALGASVAALLELESSRRIARCVSRAESPETTGGALLRELTDGGMPSPWLDKLSRGERVALAPRGDSSVKTDPQQRFAETLGVRSMLIEPLVRGGSLRGAFVALDPDNDSAWSRGTEKTTRLLALACSHARSVSMAGSRRERLDALMRHCPLGVVYTDDKGRVLAVNPAYERLSGSASAALVGQPFALIEDALRGEGRTLALGAALKRRRSWSGRLPRKREDGTPYELMAHVVPLLDEVGAAEAYLAFVRDLSSELELGEGSRWDQKHRAIGRLAAGIAHEINTPAQYVMDNVRFLAETQGALHDALTQLLELQREARVGEVSRDLVEAIGRGLEEIDLGYLLSEAPGAVSQALEGVERISAIVGALRRFASPEPGRRDLVSVNESIETTLEVGRFAWSLVAEVQTSLSPELPDISLVSSEFNQVILSLIENASEAIARRQREEKHRKPGLIRISSALREGHVEIRFEDNGAGMTPEVRDRAFEPFFSTERTGEGRGKGLANAHGVIVDRHAGTISLGGREGGGTVVTLRLPLTPAPGPLEVTR
jgi:PAS domain S-box-containing protein